MAYDWKTLITVSSSDDGWVNPNGSATVKTNIVRDLVALPYGEHKSIVVWLQESPGVYTGTPPNATYRPSLRLKAAVIDQTRVVEQSVPLTAHTTLSEALSFDDAGTLNIALTYGPIHAVKVRDSLSGTAAFIVSFDWGAQNTSGSTLSSSHELIYCTVTESTITVAQHYIDPDQPSGTTKPALLLRADTDKAVWFKSKTGTDQHTAKVITTSSSSSTMTMTAGNDLPASVTTMFGYVGWQSPSEGFIYDALGTSSEVLPYTLPVGSTTVTFGSYASIPRVAGTNVKILPGQRIRSDGITTFNVVGLIESFITTGGGGGGSSDTYDVSVDYDSSSFYDNAEAPSVPGEDPSPYESATVYDLADEYDSVVSGGTQEQVLDVYPRIFRITYTGGTFAVQAESASGLLYRKDAAGSEDTILGVGSPLETSFQVSSIGSSTAIIDSAYDAIPPTATSRFFGQEVQFDPLTSPTKSVYPISSPPFASKYSSNQTQISVGLALVASGAFGYYVANSVISASLDRPLRVTYFEHQFAGTSTPAFPPTGGGGGGR